MSEQLTEEEVGELLEELELFLGEMEDDDEAFVEEMLQREIESCQFTSKEVTRLQKIKAKYIYDLPLR